MYLLSLSLILAGAFIYVAHSKKWLIIFLLYTTFLYLVLAGLEGFVTADKETVVDTSSFLVVNTIIFLLHIPVIIKLSQVDAKNYRVKKAREIFDKDVAHLHDDKLHRHLGH